MKQSTLLLLLFFCLVLPVGGQNLVSNGSFEEMVACPTGPGQIYFAQGWGTSRGSPDYYHSCANQDLPYMGVPSNGLGFQHAASGQAYAGLICFTNDVTDAREIIRNNLVTNLTVGQQYFFSFKISNADNLGVVGYSSNKLGVKLSTEAQNFVDIDNTAIFCSETLVSDTLNWTTFSGSFIADSAYQNLMIGCFFDDDNITLLNNGGVGFWAYYFIDDVCLSTDSLICMDSPVMVEEKNTRTEFEFYPNPATNFFVIQNKAKAPFNLEVYDLVGQLLYTERNVNSAYHRLNMSHYREGILIIKIVSKNKQIVYKLLKQ